MARKKRKQTFSPATLIILALVFLIATALQRFVDKKSDGGSPEAAKAAVVSQSSVGDGNQPDERADEEASLSIDGLELPAHDGDILRRKGYTLSYNGEWKIPRWVAWVLTADRLKGKAKRTDEFLPDPDLPERARAFDSDYYRSRYDRGHMAPAGDMKWSQQAMAESFLLSNICPQAPNLNRGDWNELEEQCRKWAQRGEVLYIVCGPVVKPDVKHKRVVGKGKVLVPDGFFKTVLVMGDEPRAVGFLYPNEDCNSPIASYAVTVDSVEQVTGLDLYPSLPDELEARVEAENSISRFL